jgi:Cu/Ag efflux pump CusA
MVGNQDEQVWLSYSGQRLNQFGITPMSIIDHIQQRNINIPGGHVELPDQNVVVRPTGEYTSAAEIGQTTMDVSAEGYPLYLRDLVEVTRGYEDPSNVMNFRTVKVPRGNHAEAAHGSADAKNRCRRTTTCRPAARSRSRCGRSRARASLTTTAT